MPENKAQYDLEDRTARFGESVIDFCRSLKQDSITRPLITQIVRSATSVGANYCEANGASSKKDFRNKIFISKKEIQETKHWLRMISRADPEKGDTARIIWKEAEELTRIFGKILSGLRDKE
jgi:four helix bundle protein